MSSPGSKTTTEPRTAARPDPRQVLEVAGWTADGEPASITAGWDNHLWRFERDGAPLALRLVRRGRSSDAAALARMFEAELAAMEAARDGGIPAPAVFATGTYDGAPFMIMEWLPGESILNAIRHRPWQARRFGREFGRLQARLHTVPSGRLRPIDDTDWVGRAGNPALIAAVRSELANADHHFCHFDFHPLNVLHDGDRVTGLVDFTNASAGDIRADLGMTNAVLVAAPLPPGAVGRAMNMLRRRFTLGWREGYIDFAGQFPLTPLFEALGFGIYHHEFATAIDEGRGWADERDLKKLRWFMDDALARAGLV